MSLKTIKKHLISLSLGLSFVFGAVGGVQAKDIQDISKIQEQQIEQTATVNYAKMQDYQPIKNITEQKSLKTEIISTTKNFSIAEQFEAFTNNKEIETQFDGIDFITSNLSVEQELDILFYDIKRLSDQTKREVSHIVNKNIDINNLSAEELQIMKKIILLKANLIEQHQGKDSKLAKALYSVGFLTDSIINSTDNKNINLQKYEKNFKNITGYTYKEVEKINAKSEYLHELQQEITQNQKVSINNKIKQYHENKPHIS